MEKWLHGEVVARHVESSINIARQEGASSSVRPIKVERDWNSMLINDLVDTWYERDCPSGWAVSIGKAKKCTTKF